MLAENAAVDAERIVFVGLGNGGRAGMLLAAEPTGPYAAYVLGGCGWPEAAFPSLVETQISESLANHHGWTPEQIVAYRDASLEQWQEWLFAQEDQVAMLGRRLRLDALQEQLALDPVVALSAAKAPVLMLHSVDDPWLPVTGPRQLQALTGEDDAIVWRYLDGPLTDRDGAYSRDTTQTVSDWLAARFP